MSETCSLVLASVFTFYITHNFFKVLSIVLSNCSLSKSILLIKTLKKKQTSFPHLKPKVCAVVLPFSTQVDISERKCTLTVHFSWDWQISHNKPNTSGKKYGQIWETKEQYFLEIRKLFVANHWPNPIKIWADDHKSAVTNRTLNTSTAWINHTKLNKSR